MAQDYWRGGWANTDPMARPGTFGAQIDKNYGPLHALADMLGAYWQKRNMDKADEYAGQFMQDFDKNMAGYDEAAPSRDIAPAKTGDMDSIDAENVQPLNPEPMSFADYRDKAEGLYSKAMRDLIRKYGVQNGERVGKTLRESLDRKISDYGNREANRLYDNLFATAGNINTPSGLQGFLQQVGRHNNAMAQMGKKEMMISPQDVKGMVDAGRVNISPVNLGNRVSFVGSPQAGRFDNGAYVQEVGSGKIGISPAQQEQLRMQAENAKRAQANADRDYALRSAQFRLEVDKWKARLEQLAAQQEAGKGEGGISSQAVQSAKTVLDLYSKFNENPLNNGQANPYEESAAQAMAVINAAMGGGQAQRQPQQQDLGGASATPETIRAWVQQNRANGASDDAIKQELIKRGYNPKDFF